MKKQLLILILTLFFFSSCENSTYENSVEDMTWVEVNNILSQEKDTIIIVRQDLKIYEVTQEGIKAQYILTNEKSTAPIPFFFFILVGILFTVLGMGLLMIIFN